MTHFPLPLSYLPLTFHATHPRAIPADSNRTLTSLSPSTPPPPPARMFPPPPVIVCLFVNSYLQTRPVLCENLPPLAIFRRCGIAFFFSFRPAPHHVTLTCPWALLKNVQRIPAFCPERPVPRLPTHPPGHRPSPWPYPPRSAPSSLHAVSLPPPLLDTDPPPHSPVAQHLS